jgi:hypothetical protein
MARRLSQKEVNEIVQYVKDHSVKEASKYFKKAESAIYRTLRINAANKKRETKIKREASNHTKPVTMSMFEQKLLPGNMVLRLEAENKALKLLLKQYL